MQDLWYKDAIFYAVDVESFQDGNGDGVGDFKGLASQLDYLADLGVNCLWLLPFYTTPNKDNGYDVKDYYSIDSRLGTFADFSDFLASAREHKIRVLMDLIVHHTSDEHPWFHAAAIDQNSKFHQYYIWREEKPVKEATETIFPGEESSVWSYEKRAGAFYHHRFYSFEPDLNVANPKVQHEIRSIIEFWLAFGVDGFRVDAATHLLSAKGKEGTKIKKPVAFLKSLRKTVSQKSNTILLAEANVDPAKFKTYYGQGDRLHMLFNFLLDNYMFLAFAREESKPIADLLQKPLPDKNFQWANFLRNLDELNLNQLSEIEQQEVFEKFAPEDNMRIFNRGIRRRLAPMLKGNRKYLEMVNSLLFSMPGSPMLVYGDELGMGENLNEPGRTSVRVPMQWSDKANAGFSTASAGNLVRSPISSGPFSYKKVNVEAQQQDPASLLYWTKRLITIRKSCREIGWGQSNVIPTDSVQVLVHCYDWQGNVLVLAHNLSAKPCQFTLTSQQFHPRQFVDIFSDQDYEPTHEHTTQVELGEYGYRWFRVNELKNIDD